jgi:hypothetical protein
LVEVGLALDLIRDAYLALDKQLRVAADYGDVRDRKWDCLSRHARPERPGTYAAT